MSEGRSAHPHVWSVPEREVLASAVAAAPSVHNARPWTFVVREHVAELRPHPVDLLDEHDPLGRDRDLSLGAALTNLLLAVEHLGLVPRVDEVAEPGCERAITTVTATHRTEPSEAAERRFAALTHRRSHRGAFPGGRLTDAERASLRAAAGLAPGETRWITGASEALAVARSLSYAARVMHADAAYQRELAHWIVYEDAVGGPNPESGIPESALGWRGLPAVGLVTDRTKLPDEALLASRIEHDSVLVLCGEGDAAGDHVRIGRALQLVWLEATSRGMAASVMTQPLRLGEVRAAIAEELELPGKPHALMRFGHRS
ncbi:nitroreductase family protein [Saccharopolyspora sp. MS10]|uniref:nitroreductase family protein n=1 Tax=Saccharopolyspora sp. MS10 TaxID=3385973 RepID=UPI0039A1E185